MVQGIGAENSVFPVEAAQACAMLVLAIVAAVSLVVADVQDLARRRR